MKQLVIVIDSAGGGKRTNYGPCICYWAAFVYNPELDKTPTSSKLSPEERYEVDILHKGIKPKPKRSGAIYSDYEGPNKIFFDGIIRALEACFFIAKRGLSELIIVGDCEPVINQLNEVWKSKEMQPLLRQVKHKFEPEYRKLGIKIAYKLVKRDQYPLYEDIDKMAKDVLAKIRGVFKVKS